MIPNTIYHLTRADFLERVRSSGFILMLALAAYLSYAFVPPLDAGYTAVSFGDYRLLYNSAGIGLMFGITISLFLSLFAFYLVKNGLARDHQTRVGQIIATTTTSKAAYLVGKWGSNLLLLAVIMAVMTLMAPVMQWLRGEATAVFLLQIVLPIWLIGLPMMSIVAGTAVLFEAIPWLRGGFGNIVYFFLWSFVLVTVGSLAFEGGQTVPDPYGISQPVNQIATQIRQLNPDYDFSLNIIGGNEASNVLTWDGQSWSLSAIGWRIVWLLAGALLAVGGTLFFDRFNPANVRKSQASWLERRWQQWLTDWATRQAVASQKTAVSILTPLTERGTTFRPFTLLLAELKLLLKGQPTFILLGLAGLFIYGLVTPLTTAQTLLYPLILPVLIWSALGSRETINHTKQLIFTTPNPLLRQLPLAWLAGVLVALLAVGGFGLKFALMGAWLPLLGLLTAALFVPALAVALGVLSGTRRLFEMVYLTWWYMALNVAGSGELTWINFTDPTVAPYYLVATALLLGTAVLFRRSRL